MEITIRHERGDAGQQVLVVAGSIDLASRDALVEASREALKSIDRAALVLDLAGVTFMDSTGLSALVEIDGDALDAGVEFHLRAVSRQVRRLLEVTGLLNRWPVESP